MNLVQEKVKQRNITPNFLRFRSNQQDIQEKVLLIRSAKRGRKTGLRLRLPPKELKGAPPRPVEAV